MADRRVSEKRAVEKRSDDASPRTPLQQKILDALPERIDLPEPSFGYKLAGWWLVGVSLLLPLIYFAFVALVGHAVWWHWRNNMTWIRAGVWGFLFFLGVLASGGLTLLFLIKPLFSRRNDDGRPQIIRRSVEPFLYDYVEALCDALGAPRPRTIEVDLGPNAGAAYRRGFWSLFAGDLTLKIGLPLVSGMTVRQLSGILAHEFGHFSQGFGLRATYLSGLILQRLARAAWERDWFDAKLDEHVVFGKAGVVLYPVRFFVWIAREFVGRLFSFGLAIRSRMSREMEFDADGYQATLVGSTTLARSFSAVRDLDLAHHMAMNDIQTFYEEGRLADDFPALIVSNVPRIRPEFRKAMRKLERERKAHKFDTHPPDRDRILKAREIGPDGLLTMPGEKPDYPAFVLFANFSTVCRAATTECYRALLGPRFRKDLIHPVEKMIERRAQEHAAGEALDRYFLCHVPVDRPLTLTDDAAKPPADAKAEFETLKEARATMLKRLVAYRNLSERYDVAIDAVFTTAEALSIIDCGLAVKAEDFNLVDRRTSTVEDKHERARGAVQHLAQEMLPFEEAAAGRLQSALRLLQNPKVSERIPDGAKLAEELRELAPQAAHIGSVVSGLPSLRVLWRRINVLFVRFLRDTNQQSLRVEILKRMESLHTRLSSIRRELRNRPYPFDHADESMDLQRFVIPELPEEHDLGGIMAVTSHAFERLFTVQVRMYARLAFAADKVETALGLPPLEDPDDPEKKKSKSDGAEPAMKKTGTFATSGGGSASSPTAPKPGSTKPASKPEPKLPPKSG